MAPGASARGCPGGGRLVAARWPAFLRVPVEPDAFSLHEDLWPGDARGPPKRHFRAPPKESVRHGSSPEARGRTQEPHDRRARHHRGSRGDRRAGEHHERHDLDPVALEAEVVQLHKDDDVTKKPGIYPYVLTRDEKYLSIRAFTLAMREAAYERQAGICIPCGEHFALDAMEADHIDPWSEGGKTTPENCQMLCRPCNRRKGAK